MMTEKSETYFCRPCVASSILLSKYEKALVRTVFIAYNGFAVSDLLTGLVGSGLKIAGEFFLVYEKKEVI